MSKRRRDADEIEIREAFRQYLVSNGVYVKITQLFVELFQDHVESKEEIARKINQFLQLNYVPSKSKEEDGNKIQPDEATAAATVSEILLDIIVNI